jgi:iron complex transport system permease protein
MTSLSAPVPAGRGSARRLGRRGLMVGACAALALAMLLSLSVGATGVSLAALPRVLVALVTGVSDPATARDQLVLLEIRLPRLLLGIFVGSALALSGAMMQGMFRNPLADPGLIGVSSGAALAAVVTIATSNGLALPLMRALGPYLLPLAAFGGGILATAALVAVAARHGELAIGTLLLAGIALAALASSLTGLIAYASDDRELRDLTLWMLGSLSGASWPKALAVAPFALGLALVVPRLVRGLNGLVLGEAEAFHLGIDVNRMKRAVIIATAAATGAAVAVSGIVGFVGIIVPHLVRLLAGPDHRIVLPGSALLGAALVLTADVLARMLVRPAELPLGVVTALVGAPLFLHLVRRWVGSV